MEYGKQEAELKLLNLTAKVRVSAFEAVLGATVPVPTLDGEVRVKVPPGSSSGRRIRLRGRGYATKGGGRGDLYAELSIVVPERVSEEERALWEQLAALGGFDPRD